MNLQNVVGGATDMSGKTKSFWERPEGLTGMISLGLLGLGAFFGINALLPTINSFLTGAIAAVGKTIVLGGLCAFLAGTLYVAFHPKTRLLVKYAFKNTMRAITGVLVEINPIGIMKGYIETLNEKREVLLERKSQLRGQIASCKQMIDSNAYDIRNAMANLKAAQAVGKTNLIALNSREAGRLDEFNKKLEITHDRMKKFYAALEKYAEVTEIVIQDLKSEVKIREKERSMMMASYSAMKAAQSILNDGSDERELFDQAMEFVVEDYAQKLGEIEDFMDVSRAVVDGVDLQNAAWEQKAIEQLQAFEAKTDSILLGDQKRLIIEHSHSGMPSAAIAPQSADLNKFFK